MKVENVGNKKAWIAVFSAFGVVIVGLIIAIIVIVVNRGNAPKPDTNGPDSEYHEALSKYVDDNEYIARVIIEKKLEGEDVLSLIRQKIDETSEDLVKAMLEEDYYTMMFSVYRDDGNKKDEIINGLIRVEEILKTAESAEAIADVALGYQDIDLYNKYVAIAKERDPNYRSVYDMVEESAK